MKKICFEDISIFIVKNTFKYRGKIAKLSKKSRIFEYIIDKSLFEDDEIYIIPNDKSLKEISVNKKIEEPENIFIPTDILKKVIKEAEDIVIMNQCLCRVSNDCKDYPHDLGCIFLGKATKKINRKYCKEVTSQEALNHINECDNAGLTHLIGRNKIDSVWMNVKPKEDLLTICHCCPCCCLWKVVPDLSDNIHSKVQKLPGVEISINQDNCVLCGKCLDICFVNAIKKIDNYIVIDENLCKGCGRCSSTCKNDAINLDYTDKSINTIFNQINSLVDYKKVKN
jgi:ferredoxin